MLDIENELHSGKNNTWAELATEGALFVKGCSYVGAINCATTPAN